MEFENRKNPDYRDCECVAIVGDKRQGKTTLAIMLIKAYHRKYPDRKILVYDISDAFGSKTYPNGGSFSGFRKITLDELKNGERIRGKRMRWKKGIRRIMDHQDQPYEDVLWYMANDFKNGLIVIDEGTVVMSDNPDKTRRGVVIKHTNNRTDVWMIFHKLSYVPKRMRSDFWKYFMFKTGDSFTSEKDVAKLGFNNPDDLYAAWLSSQKQPHNDSLIMQYFEIYERKFGL